MSSGEKGVDPTRRLVSVEKQRRRSIKDILESTDTDKDELFSSKPQLRTRRSLFAQAFGGATGGTTPPVADVAISNNDSLIDRRPDKIVINFFPVKLPDTARGAYLKEAWGLEQDKPQRSQVMQTTLQGESRIEIKELGKIRVLLGIPKDNVCYNFVFVYPAEGSKFLGGYVYFQGPWRGLTPETEIVGANMLMYSDGYVSDSNYAMNLLRIDCGLLFENEEESHSEDKTESEKLKEFETHVNAAQVVEGMPSYGKLPEHDAFSNWRQWATHISWILPQHAQGLADNVEDSILAGQSGSFLFIDQRAKTLRRKYSLYSMVVRKLIESDPPHRAGRAMPHKQALRVAHKYLTGKRGQPEGSKPRLLILLGGSGAGKSTLISDLSKASNGYVDPKHPEWVLSGLDEFIEYVPEYIYAVRDVTVGYSNAATYAYSNAIKIAVAVNMECMKRNVHMIFEDTGKELSRTVRVINNFGKGRTVTIALVDNTPDVAISRAAGRFQITGRYSSADYIRSTFSNVFEHYLALKKMVADGEVQVEVDSFIYCNNNAEKPLMYMDGGSWKNPIVPTDAFTKGPVEYRPHISVLRKMLQEQGDVRQMYNKFVTKVSSGSKECEEEKKE